MKPNQSGMALITVLLLAVLLVLMSISMISISTGQMAMIGDIEGKEKALKAAEAGIDYAMGKLNESPYWGLVNEKVDFPGGMKANVSNPSTWPTFTKKDEDMGEIKYDEECCFNIKFSSTDEKGSVNNLFNPIEDPGTKTPAYTAKIISTGKFKVNGQEKYCKTLVAYLVRDSYSPYNINTPGNISLAEGPDFKGKISIIGNTANDPGIIYAKKNINSGDAAKITTNKGIFSAGGDINISEEFDGSKVPDVNKDYSLKSLDINEILTNAKSKVYGDVYELSGETAELMESWVQNEDTHEWYTVVKLNASSGFKNAFKLIDSGNVVILQLQGDTYIKDSELKITGDTKARTGEQANFEEIYDPETGTSSFSLGDIIEVSNRSFYMDLNGHNLYSEKDVSIAVNVTGEGKIISGGNLSYLTLSNSKEVLNVAKNKVSIEVPNTTNAANIKGLLYGGDDVEVKPLTTGSSLLWPSQNLDNQLEGITFAAPYQGYDKHYNYSERVTTFNDGKGHPITLGEYYDDGPQYEGGYNPPPFYRGDSLRVTKVINKDTGESVYVAQGVGDNLWFCLDYNGHKNVNFGSKYMLITPTGEDVEVKCSGSVSGITEEELKVLGNEILTAFTGSSNSVDIDIFGNIIGGTSSTDPNTRVYLNPGDEGNLKMYFNSEYQNSLVNIQRGNFKVKRISISEL